MKLLIVTQVMDREHPVLGFFTRWVNGLAAHFEKVTVICLQRGSYDAPPNVRVISLGKERGRATSFVYAMRFLGHIRAIEGEYDTVLVHMNPEYFVLCGWWWRLKGRFSALWYVHHHGGIRFKLAEFFASRIFYTSPYGAGGRSRKGMRMPAGIDTGVFAPMAVEKDSHAIYFQGRVAAAKRVDLLLSALELMRSREVPASVTLVGPSEPSYESFLREKFAPLIEEGHVTFAGPMPNDKTPELFSGHRVTVNLTAAGNYDKAVLESMACGTPTVVASPAFARIIPKQWILSNDDAVTLADTLTAMLELAPDQYESLRRSERQAVIDQESLDSLLDKLAQQLSGKEMSTI